MLHAGDTMDHKRGRTCLQATGTLVERSTLIKWCEPKCRMFLGLETGDLWTGYASLGCGLWAEGWKWQRGRGGPALQHGQKPQDEWKNGALKERNWSCCGLSMKEGTRATRWGWRGSYHRDLGLHPGALGKSWRAFCTKIRPVTWRDYTNSSVDNRWGISQSERKGASERAAAGVRVSSWGGTLDCLVAAED